MVKLRDIARKFYILYKKKSFEIVDYPYISIADLQIRLCIAQAFSQIAQALKEKSKFTTAYVGKSCLPILGGLLDLGFNINKKDELKTFFLKEPDNNSFPYKFNPIEELEKHDFDVVFIEKTQFIGKEKILENLKAKSNLVFDLDQVFNSFKYALSSIKNENFISCLSPSKLTILAVMLYFYSTEVNVLEIGAYQCGTTIFMAKILKYLKKQGKVFAFDTFCGIPAASKEDKVDKLYYDSGMFKDNPLLEVSRRIRDSKVDDYIDLIKGNISQTLPKFILDNKIGDFMFLDTDQYKGTKTGLQSAYQLGIPNIVIDDIVCAGIDTAIKEFIANHSQYTRSKLMNGVDLIFIK